MAIKNFQNRLKENGPSLSQLKDTSLAEDFSLVDFDDQKRKESSVLSKASLLETNIDSREVGVSEPLGKALETASSSSSSIYIDYKKTTATEDPKVDTDSQQLPESWEAIDFSNLIELGVHFGRPQLKQWHDRNYGTPEQAQESIYHFAYFLKHAKRGDIKTGPLNFFMGIMAKQKYFPRPDGYLSPEEEALQRRTQDLKRKSESLQKLEQELFEYSFEIWFRSLTEKEIQTLAPNIFQYEPRKSVLRQVFLNQHWLTVKSNPALDPAKLGQEEPKIPLEAESSFGLTAEEARRISDEQFGVLPTQGAGPS